MYTCEICCKIFTKKFNYMDHLKRKNPCKLVINPNNPNNPKMESTLNENIEIIPKDKDELLSNISNIFETSESKELSISDNICPYCKKSFYQKSNVNKHINNNRCKIKNEEQEKKNSNQEMLDKIKNLLDNHMTNNVTNNITNNITNNVNINIFSVGKEDLSRLSRDEIIKICTSGTYYPLVAAEIIHCNEKYPEFQNFLITNLRSNDGLVKINDKWESKSQDEILSTLLKVDKTHVTTLMKDLQIDDKLMIKLESTKDEIDTNQSKEHQKEKIKRKLYNASKMIKRNKKIAENLIDN